MWRGEDFSFALKPGDAVGVSSHERREDLDRDRPLELRIERAIDLPHAARAKRGDDFVPPKASADGHGHACGTDYTGATARDHRV
jgi:hypothetical protein